MTRITQGQRSAGDAARASRDVPRRSVVIGSLASLLVGVALSVTALPAVANVVSPSTRLTGVVRSTPSPVGRMAGERQAPRPVALVVHVTRPATTPTSRPHESSTSPATATAPTTTTTVATPVTVSAPSVTIHNPSTNIAADPDFLQSGPCTSSGGLSSCANPCVSASATGASWPAFNDSASCTTYVLGAINAARAIEGVRPMVLPTNWYGLTTAEQLFVVADLERTARGLPAYVGLNATLSAEAQRAALANDDPGLAGGFPMAYDAQGSPGFGGAWSSGFSVLAADYVWMYDDGWGGSAAQTSNVACTSAHAAGCWAHRDELLGDDPGYNPGVGLECTTCEMGTGFAMVNGGASYADLVELPQGTPPMTFTWANDVLPYLN